MALPLCGGTAVCIVKLWGFSWYCRNTMNSTDTFSLKLWDYYILPKDCILHITWNTSKEIQRSTTNKQKTWTVFVCKERMRQLNLQNFLQNEEVLVVFLLENIYSYFIPLQAHWNLLENLWVKTNILHLALKHLALSTQNVYFENTKTQSLDWVACKSRTILQSSHCSFTLIQP